MPRGGSVSGLRYQRERTGYKGTTHRKGTQDHRDCAEILKQHHEDLKDDPERLSTEYIAKMARCSCPKKAGIKSTNVIKNKDNTDKREVGGLFE